MDWNRFDDKVFEQYIQNVSCRAPYIHPYKELSECSTQEDMRKACYDGLSYSRNNVFFNPCQEMPFINYKHDHVIIDNIPQVKGYNLTDGYFVSVDYPSIAKMITQTRNVDAHTLIGHIGGYIGLFIGKTLKIAR